MEIFETFSRRETARAGHRLGKKVKPHDVIFFRGELGAGKTAFIRGLCRGMGIDARVTSPTFSIVNVYGEGDRSLYHFDMYRIENEEQLYNTGFYDYLNYGGVLAVEWSENIEDFFGDRDYLVEIEKTGPESRKITLKEAREIC